MQNSEINNKSSVDKQTRLAEPGCCGTKTKKEPKNIWQGIAYGLVPHIGCIAFIIGSILGVTVLMQFFKPLLMNRNFFYILIAISLMFATISSMMYLNRNGWLSFSGIRKKWKYLATMYSSTVGVNLLLFMIIFPLLANVSIASAATGDGTGNAIDSSSLSSIKLKVDIPCPGHAPLISNELKTIDGVTDIRFSFPNNFEVTYDSSRASKETILALAVFVEYEATVLSEFASAGTQQDTLATGQATAQAQPAETAISSTGATGGCGCGGRGDGGCGGSGGGCGGSAGGGCGGSASGGGCGGNTGGGCGAGGSAAGTGACGIIN